jgi:hypothetical protein
LSADLINLLFQNLDFQDFLEKIKIFENLTQKYIESDDNLKNNFIKLKQNFNNKIIKIEDDILEINFLPPRKDKN